MSLPRRLNRGQTHSFCRRTIDGKHLLCPDARTLAIQRYTLFLTASRYQASVELFAFTFLSTHYQGSLRDVLGDEHSRVPDFFRDLNSNLARALNARHGRGGTFWEGGSYDNTEVHGELSEKQQLLYMMTQGVVAGHVERPEDWPGTILLPEDIGRLIVVERPDDAWFGSPQPTGPSDAALAKAEADLATYEANRRKRGKKTKNGYREVRRGKRLRQRLADLNEQRAAQRRAELEAQRARSAEKPFAKPQERLRPKQGHSTLPERVEYYVPVPYFLRHLPIEEARRVLREALDEEVARILAERRAQGWTRVTGAERALAVDPHQGRGDPMPEFALNPRIAAAGLPSGERHELYEELKAWRKSHKEEVKVLEGEHPERARFPKGTYRRAQEARRFRRLRSPPRAA